MKLERVSNEGGKVRMLARFSEINKASDEEFENLVEGTKQKLGSGLVSYETGKHKEGVIVEFLGCKTPENW